MKYFFKFFITLVLFARSQTNVNVTELCADSNFYCFPKVVWTYWTGQMHEDVNEMLDISKNAFANNSNITFIFLADENLSMFIDDKNCPSYFATFSEKANFVRVCLLERFGGMWIDAGTIVNFGNEIERIISEAVEARCVCVCFTPVNKIFRFIAGFFGCPRNSRFLTAFKKEFDKMLENTKEYVGEACKNLTVRGYNISPRLCRSGYAIDLIFHKITFENPNLDLAILYLPQSRSIVSLQIKCGSSCSRCRVLHDPKTRSVPFIHLGHTARDGKKLYYKEGKYLNTQDCLKFDRSKKRVKKKIRRL